MKDKSLNPAPDILNQLAALAPEERTGFVLALIAASTDGKLALSGDSQHRATLNNTNLGREELARRRTGETDLPAWWSRELQGIQLRGASLRAASLEEAVLEFADLEGADLREAILSEANLHGAMLEEANLQSAVMRYAQMQNAVLESANLSAADLWGANLEGAVLENTDLHDARLDEANLSGADLTGANLQGVSAGHTKLTGANLSGARLQNMQIRRADLEGAVLQDADLQGLNLLNCNIKHIYISGASLEKTRLQQEQLGGAIGEEITRDYGGARNGYLALEQNFTSLGDADAASWAYVKRRRMQKLFTRQAAQQSLSKRHWRESFRLFVRYLNDRLVEWLCDYGESMPKVFRGMLTVYSAFTIIYAFSGNLVHVDQVAGRAVEAAPTLLNLATFSLVAMTTAGTPDVGLEVRNDFIHVLTGLQGALGLALLGLFAFVLGNRIRR